MSFLSKYVSHFGMAVEPPCQTRRYGTTVFSNIGVLLKDHGLKMTPLSILKVVKAFFRYAN